MHQPQFPEMTMYPTNLNQLRQPFLPPLLFVNPFTMQQHLGLQVDTGFYGLPFCVGPVYWGITQQHQHQYQAPSLGPSYFQRSRGFRKAEPQKPYTLRHKSFGTITKDHSTRIHPGHARMDASNNSGAGKVWRTPPRNPLMADHNSIQQMRTKPYYRNRSSQARGKNRTDRVDPSVYKIPTMEGNRGTIARVPTLAPAMPSTWMTAPAPSTPAPSSAASGSTASTSYTRNKNAEKQPVEEDDDFDTISLGSSTTD